MATPPSIVRRVLHLLALLALLGSCFFACGAEPADPTEKPFPVPQMTPKRTDVKPFEYVEVGKKIPNYRPVGGQGIPLSTMQRPLPPEESLKHLVVPKGFHAELFVSEKELGGGKPICMSWDERGRLWVALTTDYPNNLQPPGQGHDRIVICEDTDGDGRADKVSVFAEKLSIPASICFARGGAIVFDAGQTIFLKDGDGDGKADGREVLFGGWSQRDTHGGVSNMQYGLDNWIWAMQGYNQSRVTLGGETHEFRQGFFRFKPDCSKLEFLRSTNNNTWGLGISEEGIIFGSTANRNPSVYLPIPNRYYEAVRGWAPSLVLSSIAGTHLFHAITDKVRQVDHHGGYTAAAGHSLYTARRYPQEYWNRTAFVSDPTGHLTGTFALQREGSDFHSSNPFNLVASDDEWTAPVMAEVGPDGNVWVIDWYAYIVQHNPTPLGFKTGKGAAYESDLRDVKHGRIYRIVYDGKQATKEKPFTLAGATPQQLVETLKNDNLFWRRHAQRLLVERGRQDVVPALIELARDPSVDTIGLNVGVIHALWTLHGLGALEDFRSEATAAAVTALQHRSAGVRRNAVQVLPRTAESVAAILKAGLTRDPDAQVRLLALLALAEQPHGEAAAAAVVAMLGESRDTEDRWLPDAATCAAANNSEEFLKTLAAHKEANPKLLAITAVVAEHYGRGGPVDSVAGVLTRLAEADPRVAAAILRGLARGWPKDRAPKVDANLEQDLERVRAHLPPEQRGTLIRLAVAWGSKHFEKFAAEAVQSLLARLKQEDLAVEERIAAARELVGQRPTDKEIVQTILEQIEPRTPSDLAAGLIDSLRGSESPETGKLLLARLAGLTPAARSAALRILLSRADWTRGLLASMDKGEVRLAELALDQRQALATHPEMKIRMRALALLKRGGALPSADRQKVLEEMLPITREKGDPAAGKVVFKNVCAKCHVHSGEGARVGPDLTGVAVHTKEHLLTDILDPSRSVEANFRSYSVTTRKGIFLTGLLASESRTAIEMFDAEGKKQTILRDDIEELSASPRSLMPDGFEKQLPRQDLINLLEFLTQRGKFLPLPLAKVATAVSTRGLFTNEKAANERLIFADWLPKTFKGVPFHPIDPRGGQSPNVVLLYGPMGEVPPTMPKAVKLPCNAPAKAIHLLSGVSGWGYPATPKGSTSLIIRLHYADGQTEEHPLINGEHFADYVRRVDVPGSEFAFDLQGRQIRYLAIRPQRGETIAQIELVKGPDRTAPVVMAMTIESP
jgi:putative membrane-bound dehydrogenase-like protein